MSSEAFVSALPMGGAEAQLTYVAPLGAKGGNLRATPVAAEVLPAAEVPSHGSTSSIVIGSVAVGLAGAGLRSRNARKSKKSKKQSVVARQALDQSSRYADLSLTEEQLIQQGQHVLVAYIMKPKAGYDYLATAAHFAAESSTGTNVNVCTTDDFTKSVDALVYYIDPENEEMKIAYPNLLFDRNITDGRAMMCSVLTLTIGNNQGMGDVEYGKIYDIYFPPPLLRLFDGPSCSVIDMWRILGRGTTAGGLVVGTIIKPKLGLQPKPFGEACYAFWLGGDFIKNDEPQGNQVFCQMSECIPEVVKAMRAAQKEAGCSKLFSANITADDPAEMIARGKYILSQFGPLAENCAFLVDGYVAGGTAVTVARRNFPKQFLHYHRAGHGAVTSPQTQRGYTAFVHTKLSRVLGASGIHVGTMSFGKMEGDASDKNIAFMLQDDIADGPYYKQEWEGMIQTTPIISGGMNALRLPAFFENLGHSNVILTAGGGAFGHKDGPKQGATSCRQGEEAWKHWKAGLYGDISLSDGVIEYAKTHEEMKGAFLTFQKDADQIYPGWKEKLGYTGESSVQAASFDWQKKSAAAAFAGATVQATSSSAKVARRSSGNHTMASEQLGNVYEKPGNQELTFMNDAGYLPDGSSLATAGNNFFRPGSVDPHTDGSPLPKSYYVNDVGYLPDGTSLATAGNNFFRPGSVDPHTPGSPLPPPLKGFCNSVGYLPDGTALEVAGNLMLKMPPQVAGSPAPTAAPTPAPTPAAQFGDDIMQEPVTFFHAPLSYFALNLLTPKGPRKNPDVGAPADATRSLGKVGTVAAGSWSCTEGGWPSPALRTTSEVFYVMSGSGCLTDVDGMRHEFGAGDTVILPKGWSGRWDVTSTIHKVWTVHDHPDFPMPTPVRAVIAPKANFTQPAQQTPQTDSMQKVYDEANMSAGCWTCSSGSFPMQKQKTEWMYVLEGVFFLTNADGSAKRCEAGDSVLTPRGWSGHLDVIEPVKTICVVLNN